MSDRESLTRRVAGLLRGRQLQVLSDREALSRLRPHGQGVMRAPVLPPIVPLNHARPSAGNPVVTGILRAERAISHFAVADHGLTLHVVTQGRTLCGRASVVVDQFESTETGWRVWFESEGRRCRRCAACVLRREGTS
jgi:hypothetical protein